MHFESNFLQYTQWAGIATLALAALTILAFVFKWGIRFRLTGSTGFLLVITAGLFALSLAPLTRTAVPGALRYTLVYDNGATQTVITIPQKINSTQLDATLRQAASDLYSYGRLGVTRDRQMTIRARTVIHPEPGVSIPLYVGQVKRSLTNREDSEIAIEIYQDKLAQLPSWNRGKGEGEKGRRGGEIFLPAPPLASPSFTDCTEMILLINKLYA